VADNSEMKTIAAKYLTYSQEKEEHQHHRFLPLLADFFEFLASRSNDTTGDEQLLLSIRNGPMADVRKSVLAVEDPFVLGVKKQRRIIKCSAEAAEKTRREARLAWKALAQHRDKEADKQTIESADGSDTKSDISSSEGMLLQSLREGFIKDVAENWTV